MAGPRWFLLAMLVVFCLAGELLTEVVEDFDFPESEARVLVKRAADVESDDEDFVADEPGSGPDEGSGEPPTSEMPEFASLFYRVELTVPGLEYTSQLASRDTSQFQAAALRLSTVLELAVSGEPAQFQINIVGFEPARSVGSKVTLDMNVLGKLSESNVENIWERLLSGVLQTEPYTLSLEDFSLRRIEGRSQCPQYVGREPAALSPRSVDNWANLLIQNAFPCNGSILGWEYYRMASQGTAFVGVWRIGRNSEFILLHKTELPPAEVGVRQVILETPIPVYSGDFIGIFYPRSTANNVVAQATLDDDLLTPDQLFQTFRVQIFDDQITEGVGFNVDTLQFRSTNATFALRAVMDYPDSGVGPGTREPHSCAPQEFSCGDGYCISSEFICDGQVDCNNNADERDCTTCAEGLFLCSAQGVCIDGELVCDGSPDCQDGSDEQNCGRPVGRPTERQEEPCLEGRFRCYEGTCIKRVYKCDGTIHCPDGSDESQATCSPTYECAADQFQCRSGDCIAGIMRCDGVEDCFDGSDEEGCRRDCTPNEFQCDDGTCISIGLRCDSRPDCPNSEDELRCTVECNLVTEFACADKTQCIPVAEKCNNYPDCSDFSDELPDLCLPLIPTGPPPCPETSFRCPSGICIDRKRLCDRVPDCLDGSDEANCAQPSCGENEFMCEDDGECIPANRRCDGIADCLDTSDEAGCRRGCTSDQITCENRNCVDSRLRCNGVDDCGDGTDEAGCSRCRSTEFECNDGTCVDARYRCDRNGNCPDSSDEFNCTCARTEFRCLSNGQCVAESLRCNGAIDCVDGTDESDCARACDAQRQFTCGDGLCIDIRRRCDSRPDCRDRSDEDGCVSTCEPSQFTCSDGQCLDMSQRCDRQRDCADGGDERNCPCREGEFTCVSDGRCLPPGYRCNGNPDCSDGSDEANCVVACRADQFTCRNGACIPASARCDRRPDCADGSDERQCPSQVFVSISPAILIKRVGTSASFACLVEGAASSGNIVWTRRTGGAMPVQAQISDSRLTIVNLRPEDSGDYKCTVNTAAGPVDAHARLSVEFVGPPTSAPDPDGPCGRDQSTCSSGQCIPRDYVCDGEADCNDGSDEAQCSVSLPCEPNEFRCDNGRCAVKIWRCDGDDDCLDGSDEKNCPARIPGAPCQSDEFSCASGDQCIPLSYQCDDEIDCIDRSDEIGCIQPSIRTPPVPEIIVEINGTFSIICEAVGTPTPLIVWRLNWGNIPSGPRVTVTSYQGRGVLTVKNAVLEDAGAYTCEAINNRGSIFAVPDALIIVRRTQGVCRAPNFNAEAVTPDQCVKCFCFGQTKTCLSSSLQYSQITLGNQVALVRRTTMEPAEQGYIQYIPVSREFQVTDFNTVLRQGSYYWSLPYQYLSKRISSYGGELTYQVYYEVESFDVPTDEPDVIITGNGITLYHKSRSQFRPKAATTVKVNLVESQWERSIPSGRGTGAISEYATREDMMLALSNVTSLLIRASYDNRQSLIRLGNVLLTTGVPQNTGLGRAVFVEECTCPVGYTGYSCEECAAGFYRVQRGLYGRECVACNCHGHSNECDPDSGVCLNCRDNTMGANCNECAPGYVGNARSGGPDACQPCPCPLATPENQFSPTCMIDFDDGGITCTACPVGYEGRRCERCADGYTGNPSLPGERCVIKTIESRCDERGSLSTLTDPVTGQCDCKANVQGRFCNQCREDTFYLSEVFPYGCISCFCMGVTQTCQSTTYNRAQVILTFTNTAEGVTMTDMMRKQNVDSGFAVVPNSRELVFRNFPIVDPSVHYWSLPRQFLGDKVTAYGGNLRFTLRYSPGRDNSPLPMLDPIVEIGGNDIKLVFRSTDQVQANRQVSFSVPMIESRWVRMDGEAATREHMLMTLADLEFIHIRAAFTAETEEAAISGISLDIAENRITGKERAYAVEQCICPRGYKGLSCEDCDTGYTRTGGGLYLGLCERCQCNGHSNECDPETGVCRNCRHNTVGDSCEMCARGFYGDATRGSSGDCQRCPCPLTESPNQFSTECILDSDGQVTCTACPPGHTGRRCERCAAGYMGNPLQPGDFCRQMNLTCDCDVRGTLQNVVCDPTNQQCQCKNNVQGRRCSTCKEGYFNLDSNNEDGCLKCFCNGITSRCQSSNYFRSEIVPLLNADGTHSFEINNRRVDRPITDGFTINADKNEITFNNLDLQQRERESLFFNLPAKFRGDKVSSYGGYLRFTLSYTTAQEGVALNDVDVEIISGRGERVYYLFRPSPIAEETNTYEILLTEKSFRNVRDVNPITRDAFMALLADIDAILIRTTYHTVTTSVTLRDLSMDIAVPGVTGLRATPEVESCTCPEGYTGLSCQSCASGYLRVEDPSTGLGRCTRCNCNGHASSCDPITGECQNCQHNTEGERCERCITGYYGDPTSGTPNDCRPCPCPLTTVGNQFSPSCFLERDNQVTCDRCPQGYTGRNCGQCAPGFVGNPLVPGGRCERDVGELPGVVVNPTSVDQALGSSANFQCRPSGRGPFSVVWSRLDGRALSRSASQGPGPNYLLTISSLQYSDSARYVCTVTNAFGTNRAYAVLKVEAPDRPIRIRIEEPTTFQGQLGQTARFSCTVVQFSGSDNYVLSWSKDGGRMPDKAIDQAGMLIIPDLEEADLGSYTCTGSDPTSRDTAQAVIVLGSNPPTVRIEPRYLQVDYGQRVEFRCLATGSPIPTVQWFKGKDGPLPDYVYTDENGVFRIDSVTMEDQSEYHCRATNEEGSSSVRTIIYVSRQTQPVTIVVRQTNITATVGESRQLICYANGGNNVVLTWTKDRGVLPIGATQENGVLTLTNIQPDASGLYYCTGTGTSGNTLGRVGSRITVVGTTYEAPTVQVDPERQIIGTGQTASIRCIVTGEPTPQVTWTKARGELTANHQVTGNILRIVQATMEDRAMYVCTASNFAGSAQAAAIVDVERREAPRLEIYPGDSQVLTPGQNVDFMCRIVGGAPRPTLTWTRVGNQPMTSRTTVMTENGVIRFTSITSDEQGEYLCSATNEVGTVTATVSVSVQGPPTVTITPGPRITSLVGSRVNIECVGVGSPTPNVFWRSGERRRSDVLPEAFDTGPGSATLLFEDVRKGDAGRYICVAANDKGRTEDMVDLIVEDRSTTLPGVTIQGPQQIQAVLGQQVQLNCITQDVPNPRIRWRRPGGLPLPPGHSVQNGILIIPRLTEEYGGEYICVVTSGVAGPSQPEYKTSAFIIVRVSPSVMVTPSRVRTTAGNLVRLRCEVTQPGEVTIEWQRVDGPLSSAARESNGVLEIRQVTRADAGRYKCVVRGQAGISEGYADVFVVVPPTVRVNPRENVAYIGNVVSINCEVTGEPTPQVRWDREGAPMPAQHSQVGTILTLFNVQLADTGRYVCSAQNENGIARDMATLRVADQGTTISDVGVHTAYIGERTEFLCVAAGGQGPQGLEGLTIRWEKVDGELPAKAEFGGAVLILTNLQLEDSGQYRCTVTSPGGMARSTVTLIVQDRPYPTFVTQSDYKTAALGSPTQLSCDAVGDPQPTITWVKEVGDLPDQHELRSDGNLYIPRVRAEDEGKYKCQATNIHGTATVPVTLLTRALVPYFQQNPRSYMSYPPLDDVYLELDIQLSFRPEATDGLVLYNGEQPTSTGDYVCFGLQGQYPEFRYDMGAGPAVITGARQLELNKWHTVRLKRNRLNGTMMVNDEPAYEGRAPGKFHGLNIVQPMYIGSVPDFDKIPRSASFRTGFIGGISEIRLNGVSLNLGEEAIDIVDVEQYEVCRDRPCENGGICVPENNAFGFRCDCRKGYAGDRCQMVGERCYPGACGEPSGRCYNHPGPDGFSCICKLGFHGEGCDQTVQIVDPSFNKTSFISYDTITNGLMDVSVSLNFKPRSLDDGIVLYNAQRQDGTLDFIAIIIKDTFLEFRFDTGSGPAVLRSRQPLRINEWTTVRADRSQNDGTLVVNSDQSVNERVDPNAADLFPRLPRGDVVRGSATGNTVGLNLNRPLYLGGVDPFETVNPNTGTDQGFVGCIGELKIGDTMINIIEDAKESLNIKDCGDRTMCSRRPCQNGAECVDIPPSGYECRCRPGFTGPDCQTEINICVTAEPCRNGGSCVMIGQAHRCNCPLGWVGDSCETEIILGNSVEFMGDGFAEYAREMFTHHKRKTEERIEIQFQTTEKNGLMFWQGQPPGDQSGKDYFALAVNDGYLEFSYELGSGPGLIRSSVQVDDGFAHTVVITRLGREGTMTIDNGAPVTGRSKGVLQVLNASGNVFIGGVPHYDRHTAGLFSQNFIGCIKSISIAGSDPIDFGADTPERVGGMNVQQCSF